MEKCYSGAVYDVLRSMGLPDQILPRTIRPLDPTKALAGRIFTVSGHADYSVDGHTTLLEWTRMLSRAPRDSVVICQPNDDTLAHMGELSAETFVYKGVRGYLCDGGCRDTVRILETGLRVWFRYHTPRDVVGRWVPDGFGEPIVIGGVSIRTGDYLMADRDGALIIPAEIIDEVTIKVEEVLRTGNRHRSGQGGQVRLLQGPLRAPEYHQIRGANRNRRVPGFCSMSGITRSSTSIMKVPLTSIPIMKHTITLIFAMLLTPLAALHADEAYDLRREFSVPPVESRTWVWWRWVNGSVSKEGITRDMEAMRDKGISGAVVFDSGEAKTDMQPKGPPFMSDPWRTMFKHALSEAERCGITLSFNICSGWSAGGPWVTPEHAIKELVSAKTVVNGPGRVSVALPKPPIKKDYYRDIALLAMPKDAVGWNRTQALDLTGFMTPDGMLNWDAPAGEWNLLRIGYTLDGHKTVIVGSGPGGFEIDPLSREAMDLHFAETVAKLAADAGPLAGKVFQYVSIDSWEVGQPTWTVKMSEEFQKRRGYDLMPWLPALVGETVDNPEETRRVLQDHRRTIADMIAGNYYGRLRELAVKAGLRGTTSESGGPSGPWIDTLQCLGGEDVPMGEFWKRQYEPDGPVMLYGKNNYSVKNAAAAARLYGKGISQAESFSSLADDLTETPWNMKDLGDSAYCDGLTRIVFHSYISQVDPSRKPGIYWQHIGISLGYNLTWWPMSEGWLTYLARCQHLLRQGVFVADFAYLQSETIKACPPGRFDQKPMRPAGFDYDPMNTDVLLNRVSARNGRLVLPDGMSYRYLVVPEDPNALLSDAAIKKVNELAAAGVCVIGSEKLSGRVEKMRQGKLDQIVTADGLKPDVEISNASKDASFDWIHRWSNAVDIYFVSNQSANITSEVKADITFRVANKVPELWDAVTGKIRPLSEYKQTDDGRITIPMVFAPRQSWFVVFVDDATKRDTGNLQKKNFPELRPVQELTGAWTVQFDPKWFYPDNGTGGKMTFPALSDWAAHADPAIKYYSGIATYSQRFDWPASSSASKLFLDLGAVNDVARVKINGQDLGIVWTAPWRVEIPDGLLRANSNELEIEVANCWPNRLIGDGLLPKEERRTFTNINTYEPILLKGGLGGSSNWARSKCKSCQERIANGTPPKLLSSGLLGPVTLLSEQP